MKNIIHHIRRKPEEIRRHILHVLILCFAIILFLLWIYSLGTTFNNPDTGADINQSLKPFSALKDNIVSGYNRMTEPDQNTGQ